MDIEICRKVMNLSYYSVSTVLAISSPVSGPYFITTTRSNPKNRSIEDFPNNLNYFLVTYFCHFLPLFLSPAKQFNNSLQIVTKTSTFFPACKTGCPVKGGSLGVEKLVLMVA